MPMRSGARQRPEASRCGITLRHRYDDVGLPCRKTMGRPTPISTNAMWLSRTGSRRRSYRSAAEMGVLAMLSSCPGTWYSGTLFGVPLQSKYGSLLHRHERACVPALAWSLLSHVAAGERVAAVLRRAFPDRRAQPPVLPGAAQGGVRDLAPHGTARVRLRRQGEPLPDASQAPQAA